MINGSLALVGSFNFPDEFASDGFVDFCVNVARGINFEAIFAQVAQIIARSHEPARVTPVFAPADTWLSLLFADLELRCGDGCTITTKRRNVMLEGLGIAAMWRHGGGHMQMYCYVCGTNLCVERGLSASWWQHVVRRHRMVAGH